MNRKKVIIFVGILIVVGVIATILVINANWGEYESDIDKSEITDSVAFSSDEEDVPPSIDALMGLYTADKSNGETAEILFNTKGLKATKGGFDDFTISFEVPDDYKSSSLDVLIKTESLSTGNETRDEHLMDVEFFDAAKYPEISFTSSSIALGDTSYMAIGELTLNGTTKNLDLPFLHLGTGGAEDNKFEAFKGAFEIDRTEFGQEESAGVGNIVKLNFYCELTLNE